MKISIIGDIHIGSEKESKGVIRKLSRYSEDLVKDFLNDASQRIHPEFIVQMGDAIEDESHDVDIANYKKVLSFFQKFPYPTYNLVGNHEQRTLSENEIKTILGYKKLYYSFDYEDKHFVILFSDDFERVTPIIPKDQLEWLTNDLRNTQFPAIVFVHHSLADQDLIGNFWFEGKPERCLIGNRQEIRKILEDSGKVKLVLNAHLHWNNCTIHNSIPYITLPSLVENYANNGIASKAWATLEITNTNIILRVEGNEGAHYTLSI